MYFYNKNIIFFDILVLSGGEFEIYDILSYSLNYFIERNRRLFVSMD